MEPPRSRLSGGKVMFEKRTMLSAPSCFPLPLAALLHLARSRDADPLHVVQHDQRLALGPVAHREIEVAVAVELVFADQVGEAGTGSLSCLEAAQFDHNAGPLGGAGECVNFLAHADDPVHQAE